MSFTISRELVFKILADSENCVFSWSGSVWLFVTSALPLYTNRRNQKTCFRRKSRLLCARNALSLHDVKGSLPELAIHIIILSVSVSFNFSKHSLWINRTVKWSLCWTNSAEILSAKSFSGTRQFGDLWGVDLSGASRGISIFCGNCRVSFRWHDKIFAQLRLETTSR